MSEPSAEEVTLATLREWAEHAMATTSEADPLSTAGGFRRAAGDVLAIISMNGRPPGEPVVFSPDI